MAEQGHAAIQHREERLTKKLERGTKKSHILAEKSDFVKRFRAGTLDRDRFGKLLSALYHVYTTFERELEIHKDNPVVKGIYFPEELSRKEALEKDLAYFYGEQWQDCVRDLSEATKQYVDRLMTCSKNEPEVLVSHAYTRYMGDLSGGQILKKFTRKSLNLQGDGGTDFYDFKRVPNISRFKRAIESSMDSLKLTDAMVDRLIEEANMAFELNIRLFIELEDQNPDEVIKQYREREEAQEQEAFVVGDITPHPAVDGKADPALCPFNKLLGLDKLNKQEEKGEEQESSNGEVKHSSAPVPALTHRVEKSAWSDSGQLLFKLGFVVLVLGVLGNLLVFLGRVPLLQ